MSLQKILFKAGVNRENTRYTTEGGWYECDKIRFRQGNPEAIGGWVPFSTNTFQGVCRSLWNWSTLNNINLIGVGTNLKFYIENGKNYYDITPIRTTTTLGLDPFTGNGTTTVTVTAPSNGALAGDFVTFSGVTGTYATLFNKEYQIATVAANGNSYTITTASNVAIGTTGGSLVSAAYQLNTGQPTVVPFNGWGAGPWGYGTWGNGGSTNSAISIWSQNNWGQDLVFGPRGGGVYYWIADDGTSTRGVALNTLGGTVSISLSSPTVVTSTILFTEGTALQFSGPLPSGMLTNTTYYVYNVDGLSFNLIDAAGNIVNTLNTVSLSGVAGYGFPGSVGAIVNSATLALTGVSATVTAGNLRATTSNKATTNLFGVRATSSVGSVNALVNNVTVDLSGNTATGIVNNVAISGTITGYISLIVDVPVVQNNLFVSDINRFVFAFGCNDYGSSTLDPMLIRWSDQENIYEWTPNATNQSGSIRLSHGSQIVSVTQTRQEIITITDQAVYSVQYLGPPVVWQAQLMGDNISIIGPNAAVVGSGVVYWMGKEKFYVYNGRVQTLNCDLRRYIFQDFNQTQGAQVYASTNEAFNEVWWFYCSANATQVDRYVVYNYLENTWYYGTLARSAWLDSGLQSSPVAATYNPTTQTGRLISHEVGTDDNIDNNPVPLNAYISSSEFDIEDGHNFGFVWRVIPDLTFSGSSNDPMTNAVPQVTMTLYPMQNSGSGVGKTDTDTVKSGSIYTIPETFTGQVYTRVRGRQLIFKVESNQLGTTWQLGAPRIDIRKDGRR